MPDAPRPVQPRNTGGIKQKRASPGAHLLCKRADAAVSSLVEPDNLRTLGS